MAKKAETNSKANENVAEDIKDEAEKKPAAKESKAAGTKAKTTKATKATKDKSEDEPKEPEVETTENAAESTASEQVTEDTPDVKKDTEKPAANTKTTRTTKNTTKTAKEETVEHKEEETTSEDEEKLLAEISDDIDKEVLASRKTQRGRKKSGFDKSFDIEQVGEKEIAYISEKRRVFLSDDFANQYKDDSYVPSLLLPDAPTQYDYYLREKQLYTQSAISHSATPLILSGIIIGTDTTKNKIPYVIVKTDATLTAQMQLQKIDIKHLITVRIPASALFFESQSIRNSKDSIEAGDRKLQKELEERLNSRIFYVAENFQEELKICWCSRVAAMLEIQRRSFLPRDERPALLRTGCTTSARVIAVGHNKVTVEVDGVDCVLTRKTLSWLSLGPSLKKEFHVNETFTVKILSVEYAKDTYKFRGKNVKRLSVTVSKIAAENDPANEYYNYYINNPTATGVITSELTADGVYVRLADMIDVLCDVSIDEPVVGAPCKVRLLHAEQREDKHHDNQLRWYLKGIIKEVLPLENSVFRE